MPTDETTEDTMGAADDMVDRIEKTVINRREFLVGAVVGGVSVGGAISIQTFAEGTQLERRAMLASGGTASARTQYHLPAIGSEGEGLVIDFTVAFTEGEGDIYVNLDDVEVRHDLQLAIREATVTATTVTDAPLAGQDVFVSFNPPRDGRLALRGKSWEAGLTIALISALTGRKPSRQVLVTGGVGSDGALLPVGNIAAKAKAARTFGAETLLVPPEQTISLSGIDVKAVGDITQVSRHVFGW
ncbi:S16 family serine protease [Halorussus salinisoli]|uniref:S16 family serine protease n=1 Tax=Halorussus salinisoli TaxID=2558242 RepID=UPI0010C22F2A|nr:S16 family serine protease [Halorussus salinisoli]